MGWIWALSLLAAGVRGDWKQDVVYSEAGGEKQCLDAFVPEGAGPFPACILVHGGGWVKGDKYNNFRPLLEPLSKEGFAWFSINYRLAPEHRYPACVEDVESAIRWLKARAPSYKVDADRIALVGESAGGHLVSLAAARAQAATRVAAVVAFYAPNDLLFQAEQNRRTPAWAQALFGLTEMDDAARQILREASPITWIRPDMPRFLLIHGSADERVPVEQSRRFQERMRAVANSCDLHLVEGAGHGLVHWDRVDAGYKERLIMWMHKALEPRGGAKGDTAPAGSLRAERMSWLENDRVRLGVDLNRGGAITYLAPAKDGGNVVNNFDLGRQVQLSFFSGPVPFEADGQKPAEHWRHIGWNPIQTGDDFNNTSQVLAHENDGRRIHVTCRPLQWPLNQVPGECLFDSWVELEGAVVRARARLSNARSDLTQYPARLQELPAVYANAAFPRVVSYQGGRPFAHDAVTAVPGPQGKHPWSFWTGTEGWAALLDGNDFGLGLITPGRVHFTGGFAGVPGPNDTRGNSTGYLAGQGLEVLDHNIVYEFHYELVLGSLDEIRTRAARWRPQGLPAWSFARDRQGWHYQNATDAGWPVREHLQVALGQDDPQLLGPLAFWQAEEAPYLVMEAAFHTSQTQGTVMWQGHGAPGFSPAQFLSFPIVADGEFRRHVIHLAAHPGYRGGMLRLRIDPVGRGEPGAWMRLRSVRLAAAGDG